MIDRLTRSVGRKRAGETGFTLIELLVVIVILGILAAVVVFAVQGTGDKGAAAAFATDAQTIRTSEEAYCAKFGRYGTAQELVDAQLLSSLPTMHTVLLSSGGSCTGAGVADKTAFFASCAGCSEISQRDHLGG